MLSRVVTAILGVLFAFSLASTARAGECATSVGYKVIRIEGRAVAVWYPTTASPAEYHYTPRFSGLVAHDAPVTAACGETVPLIVFSHGYTGCGLQSVAFTEELARSGYVVAAPDHADAAICQVAPLLADPPPPRRPAQPNIFSPGAWNDTSRSDRRRDIEVVIDYLLRSAEFGRAIDPQKIGLAGHSLGGYTVVGIAGGWASWLDLRICAVLAFSPYVMPFQVKNTLPNVRVPLMYQGGSLDAGITPFLKGPKGAYAAANPPVYFVELRNAAHFAWSSCGNDRTTQTCLEHNTNARLIAQYGIAFFNRHLKGAPEPLLDAKNPSLAEYKFRLEP